jgi:hypothetical protein
MMEVPDEFNRNSSCLFAKAQRTCCRPLSYAPYMQRLTAIYRLTDYLYSSNNAMFCGQIISSDILPLTLQDTVEEALRVMQEKQVNHLR